MPVRVSLIIATYNRGDLVADTIRMAAAQNYPDYEVIVVHQDLVIPDSVQRAIADSGERVQLIRTTRPNLPAARNAGVRIASGEIVVFIDDDVIIGPEFIASHARVYENPAVGGATGLTVLPHEHDDQVVSENLLAMFLAKGKLPDGTASVRWVVGCNCSFRKRAILEAGMSDTRFTGWAEDADLSVRVAHLNYVLLFDPRIRLIHLAIPTGGCELRTTGEASEKKIEEMCRMYLFFCLKNRTILGRLVTVRAIWRAYRQYSLNRSLVQSWRAFRTRQGLFVRSFIGALRLARTQEMQRDAQPNMLEIRLNRDDTLRVSSHEAKNG